MNNIGHIGWDYTKINNYLFETLVVFQVFDIFFDYFIRVQIHT